MPKAQIREDFKIECEIYQDSYSLIVSTAQDSQFPKARIPITAEQWNALRFSFATAHNDRDQSSAQKIKLTYIK